MNIKTESFRKEQKAARQQCEECYVFVSKIAEAEQALFDAQQRLIDQIRTTKHTEENSMNSNRNRAILQELSLQEVQEIVDFTVNETIEDLQTFLTILNVLSSALSSKKQARGGETSTSSRSPLVQMFNLCYTNNLLLHQVLDILEKAFPEEVKRREKRSPYKSL